MLFFVLSVLLSVLFYFKFIRPCGYWSEKRIKHANCWPGVGSMGWVFLKQEAFSNVAIKLYKENDQERYVGYMQFMQHCLLVRDIEIIKQITVKDFNYFTDHATFQDSDADPLLSKSLISLSGEKWRNLRAIVSPVFTSNKLKNMYVFMEECAEDFINHFEGEVEVEMKDVFTKVACNVIASTAFGIQIDCLKDTENEFLKKGLRLTNFTFWQSIKLIIIQTFPNIVHLLRLELFPRDVTKFFRAIIKDSIEKRESGGSFRIDLIHLLLEARKEKLKLGDKNEDTQTVELTDEHILAQAMLFFFAGLDTVSTTSSFLAHELAVNPEIQKKLQEEIDDVRSKHGSNISYEVILGMKYLDQVVSETLRLWPVVYEIDRLCVNDYYIQGRNDEKGFLIEKGVDMVIPTMAIQRDPQYFPEPNRFDPERFNDENRAKIIPGTYLPFGWGQRNCLGSRFALLEIKTLFYHLLSKFDVVPIARTQIPIKISRRHVNMQPENGFWLGLKPRKNH